MRFLGGRLGRGVVGISVWLSVFFLDDSRFVSCSRDDVRYNVDFFDDCGVICIMFIDFFDFIIF